MDIIYTNQINLIRKCKLFLNKNIKNKIEVDISPLCFFTNGRILLEKMFYVIY